MDTTEREICQKNLTSDIKGQAKVTDPNLVNPWGIVFDHKRLVLYVAVNGSNTIDTFTPNGIPTGQSLTVGSDGPTGLVLNHDHKDFLVSGKAAKLIVVTESGSIATWTGESSVTNFTTVLSNPGAIYKGAALGTDRQGNQRLFVANFAGAGTVEVYDSTFQLLRMFTDSGLSAAGYNPFNVNVIDHRLYVSFAKSAGSDEAHGPGEGYIDLFSLTGNFVSRFVNRSPLNAPWAMIKVGENIWVGNFGDGKINVFSSDGCFLGPLLNPKGAAPLEIDGLWGLVTRDSDDLSLPIYFTAGIDDENHGLLGFLQLLHVPWSMKHFTKHFVAC